MQHLFEELVAEVQRTSPATAATLRPGLPPEFVKEKMANMPFQISADAVALYSWADGATDRFEMLPGAYFSFSRRSANAAFSPIFRCLRWRA